MPQNESTGRIDKLLQRALETGSIPEDATETERIELAILLAGAEAVRTAAVQVRDESNTVRPVAKARFERFLAAESAISAPPAHAERIRWWHPRGRRVAISALAVAVVVVLAALVIVPTLFQDVETASAQVLEPGDYVQLSGVVSGAAGADSLEMQSPFGPVTVSFDASSEVVDGDTRLHPSQLARGDALVVDGIVGEDRRVRATTLARGGRDATPPAQGTVEHLRAFRDGLEGHVVSFALAEGSSEGRVLIETANGARVLIDVDAVTVQRLLNAGDAAIGVSLRIERPTESERRFQALPIATPVTGTARFVLQGLVTEAVNGSLLVQSLRGPVQVRLSETTRIALGDSGLTRDDFLSGDGAVGQRIAVTGPFDPVNQAIDAHVIVVGDGERGRRR